MEVFDLISRQAAIAFVKSIPYIKEHQNMGELIKEWIEQIPAIQPEQKTGWWIPHRHTDAVLCSVCGKCYGDKYRYCPHCGAKMEEVK